EVLSIEDQVSIITAILEGESSDELAYYRNQVIFNTAARYYLFGKTTSMEEGLEVADKQLKSQKGAEQLNRWRSYVKNLSLNTGETVS
ncbi:hypothetical protein, partial [Pseudomonas sp. 2995-1]|uniref:hypothetical protein n=1 Tax=Pseudomonas sp. 2995-1 TaxID=1712679 RepID=UPI001C469B84